MDVSENYTPVDPVGEPERVNKRSVRICLCPYNLLIMSLMTTPHTQGGMEGDGEEFPGASGLFVFTSITHHNTTFWLLLI